ncbi:hypothetical protein N9D66_01040 [Candidatus Nanopelagicales bacterium]|nr:hypothetical protein [Candidatus Nanopelagicales bacterium]
MCPPAETTAETAAVKPEVAGIDIDGVLADPTHRLHYLAGQRKDWRGFFSGCGDDTPLETGIALVHQLVADGLRIVYVSGRPERLRTVTLDWFARYDLPSAPMQLRPMGDFRPAPDWKLEVYQQIATEFDVRLIVDDDVRVVKTLTDAGFPVRFADWYQPPDSDRSRLTEAQDTEGRT